MIDKNPTSALNGPIDVAECSVQVHFLILFFFPCDREASALEHRSMFMTVLAILCCHSKYCKIIILRWWQNNAAKRVTTDREAQITEDWPFWVGKLLRSILGVGRSEIYNLNWHFTYECTVVLVSLWAWIAQYEIRIIFFNIHVALHDTYTVYFVLLLAGNINRRHHTHSHRSHYYTYSYGNGREQQSEVNHQKWSVFMRSYW